MKIYGFGLIKNGVKFDFPFRESITSMLPIVDKVFYNYGPSEDRTLPVLQTLPQDKMVICEKSWDDARTDGGQILSEMTNHALGELRKSLDPIDDKDAWAIYLQSDEILHEKDLDLLKHDIYKANEQGCDCIRFRYLHFWQSHNQIAVNKKWYPHEVRAIKVFTEGEQIISWGDAQGFKNYETPFYTEATIYHYGHVRDEKAYEQKMDRMRRYYHPTEGFENFVRKWKKKDENTITLNFFGTHPEVMRIRMERLGGIHRVDKKGSVFIKSSEALSPNLLDSVRVESIVDDPSKAEFTVKADYSWLDKFLGKTIVPRGMYSKLAKPWTKDFYIKMKLYEKGIGTD